MYVLFILNNTLIKKFFKNYCIIQILQKLQSVLYYNLQKQMHGGY